MGAGLARLVSSFVAVAALAACGGRPEGGAGTSPSPQAEGSAAPEAPALPGGEPPGAGDATLLPGRPAAGTARTKPSAAPADTAGGAGALQALQEARKVQVRAALQAVNKALISFYAVNDRYPADQAELESAPEVAVEVADLKALSESLSYTQKAGTYTLKVKPRGGSELTMTGTSPGPRGGVPPPKPAGT